MQFVDHKELLVQAPAKYVYDAICRIGGDTGWYYADFLWNVRGWIDKLVGGVGMRASESRQRPLTVGDIVDFWRADCVQANHCLRLQAEMKMPGKAWLEFRVFEVSPTQVKMTQTASYDPQNFWGRLYWYSMAPAHFFIFKGMIREIGKAAELNYRQAQQKLSDNTDVV